MSELNYNDYIVVSLQYSDAIPTFQYNPDESVYEVEEFSYEECDGYDFVSFKSFIQLKKRPVHVFSILEYYNEKDIPSTSNSKFSKKIHAVLNKYKIEHWEKSENIQYDFKNSHTNNALAKVTNYYLYKEKEVFQAKETDYLWGIIKRNQNFKIKEGQYLFKKSNLLMIYNNLKVVLNLIIESSEATTEFKQNIDKPIAKSNFKDQIVERFIEGQSFIWIQEVWSLNEFRNEWDLEKYRSLLEDCS